MYRLGPAARAAGHRLHVHEELASTNAHALALAREAGETGPLWVVAHRQSAGRGRRGNPWHAPEGNLAASLLLPVGTVPAERLATLGFVAGLALVRALDDVAPAASRGGSAFRLKWPNDVLVENTGGGGCDAAAAGDGAGKIAGILLEAEGRRAVVAGIGVNVAAAPDGLPYPASALAAIGCSADAPSLLLALAERFVETLRIWNKGHGFADVRRHWLERAAGIGAPVAVRLADRVLSGRHDGIDEGGRLVILAPDGTTHTVTAGEVHFGVAATAA